MPLWTRVARCIVAASALALVIGRTVSAAGPTDQASLQAVDRYLADERSSIGIPGLALVVVQGDRIVHATSLGIADDTGRPITPQTPFLLASLSKSITAIAVMQLVETGRVDLEAPVQRYVPWFTLSDPAGAARITLRELLNHTSGLSPRAAFDALNNDDQDAGALERAVRGLATASLISAPGAEYHYANSNYDILGLVVQKVSGEAFSDYIERHVFGPLDMRHSHATLAAARADGLAAGYQPWFDIAWRPASAPVSRASIASGRMFASAEDLGHELIAQLNGGAYGDARVLSPSGVAALQTPTVKIDDAHGYAMGLVDRPLWEALDPMTPGSGRTFELPVLIEHSGSWNNAHTYLGFVPSRGWGIALLVNGNDRRSESRLLLLEQNVLRILNGRDPMPWIPGEEPLARYAVAIGLVLLLAELLSFAWSVWLLRRTRQRGSGPRLGRGVALGAGLALAIDALVVWLVLAYVPGHFDTTVSAFLRGQPDLAVMVVPAMALAALWGPARTVLIIWRRRVQSRERQRQPQAVLSASS